MNLDKIFNICKASKRFVVFRQNPKTQWIGDGVATYIVTHSPKLTPEYLTASASLKPQEVENTLFKNNDFPERLETADKVDNENFVVPSEITINFFDGEYTPVFTSQGIRFIKTIYLKPFGNEEYELYERYSTDSKMYFVLKSVCLLMPLLWLKTTTLMLKRYHILKSYLKKWSMPVRY